MKKLMRRIATASVSVTLAGGALLAAGGSATAATSQDSGPTPAPAALTADAKVIDLHGIHHDRGAPTYGHRLHDRGDQDYGSRCDDGHGHAGTYRTAGGRFDPWVDDQLLKPDPWIKDQLAMFVHSGEPGHRHFV
ncbi:hypothetical protein J2Z21_007183 [Streptomyces griseochromogenes]|uniref:Uncharacterized protein n=1 Tax=Streptomyces griseochromogenes TaxID=68214 RepID=A0A1B1AYU7_9ACTN|nr:hypothetical protein [Streptomyces griseochromogenes]ANP51692.1 hypothetical protein AVL59_20715 [Streptomyces griseochromogenes]MBP2054180.1 hypothetical protein [Streptomyces griseochromogenes]